VTTLNRGWLFTGEYSIHRGEKRGTDPAGLPLRSFVFCIQNHDRVGNRAFGERLNHQIDLAAYRAASALLLLAPQTPLLFLGQEWAASSPFLFFTDHDPKLGHRVREGRLREFRSYQAFQEVSALGRIPDPQAESTFLASRLDWSERDREPHAGTLRLYRELLALRRKEAAFAGDDAVAFRALPFDEHSLLLRYQTDEGPVLIACRLRRDGSVRLSPPDIEPLPGDGDWNVLLSTEDPRFAAEPMPPDLDRAEPNIAIHFRRPGAVVLSTTRNINIY
jgi:maltooligosyltrehalose trehalohydrolase